MFYRIIIFLYKDKLIIIYIYYITNNNNNMQTTVDLRDILTGNSNTNIENTQYSSDKLNKLIEIVDNERDLQTTKIWSKLDMSIKFKLINKYIEQEAIDNNLELRQIKQLTKLLHISLSKGLLNKQSNINYDNIKKKIIKINILEYDKPRYTLKHKENNTKVITKSKTNIDKLVSSKKKSIKS